MTQDVVTRLENDYYTTQEVARAVGRKTEHWCRIRHKYVAKYGLKVVRVGRKHFYEKESVNRMVDDLLKNGDE